MDDRQVLIETWKQAVAVQMHFNDLAMKIRAFALTLIAAILTAQSLAAVRIIWLPIAAALGCWFAFYLMDRWWYHYLLVGAVLHARDIEESAGTLSVVGLSKPANLLGLTGRIAELNREAFKLMAKYKLDLYYLLIGSGLLLLLPARGQFRLRWALAIIVAFFIFWFVMVFRGTRKAANA